MVDVRDYVCHMRTTRGLGERSVARQLTVLRGFYGWLVREGLVETSPVDGVDGPRFRRPLPQVLPAGKLAELLEAPGRRRASRLWVRRCAAEDIGVDGSGVGEACALDVGALDLSPGRVTVRRALVGEEARAVLGHAGYDTLVPYTVVAATEARGSLEADGRRVGASRNTAEERTTADMSNRRLRPGDPTVKRRKIAIWSWS